MYVRLMHAPLRREVRRRAWTPHPSPPPCPRAPCAALAVVVPQERGVCYGFEGEKRYVSWFRSYLIIASVEVNVQRRTTVSIFDLKNRFIAFSLPLPGMATAQPRMVGSRV
jgi:hypothetical protein